MNSDKQMCLLKFLGAHLHILTLYNLNWSVVSTLCCLCVVPGLFYKFLKEEKVEYLIQKDDSTLFHKGQGIGSA
jgi:hypothetical protein